MKRTVTINPRRADSGRPSLANAARRAGSVADLPTIGVSQMRLYGWPMTRCVVMFILATSALIACHTKAPSENVATACTDVSTPALAVYVRDSVTGLFAASGSTASAVSGSYTDRRIVAANPALDTVPVSLAPDRAGTYDVRISKPGYADWAKSGVVVETSRSQCPYVITVKLTALLQRGL